MSMGMAKKRRWNLAILAAVLALMTAACGSSNPLGGGEVSGDLKSVVVGSADFPESKIIAEIYAQALEANGFTVGRQFGIGSRETYIPAVRDHSIDLIPEYTGNLLQYFDKNTEVTTPDDVLLALFLNVPRRPVDPEPVSCGGQGHRGGQRSDGKEVESERASPTLRCIRLR